MRKISIFFCFISLVMQAHAQTETYHQELNFNLTKLGFDEDTREAIIPSFLTGVQYKKHVDKVAYRAGIDYTSLYIKGNEPKQFGTCLTIKRQQVALHAGIERMFRERRKSNFYFGADFIYQFVRRKSIEYGYADFPPYDRTYAINSKQHSIGISPFLGFAYHISHRISIQAESSVLLGYLFRKNVETSSKYKRFIDMNASPISRLAVCYRF